MASIGIDEIKKSAGYVEQRSVQDTGIENSLLGKALGVGGSVVKSLLPRTAALPQEALDLATQAPTKYPKPTTPGEAVSFAGKQIGDLAKTIIPAGGELAALFSPVGEESTATSFLGKAGSAVARFGVPGFVYGLTSSEKMTTAQRLGEGVKDAAFFTVAGQIVGKVMSSLGIEAVRTAVKPDVPESDIFNYIANQQRAIKTTLSSTPPTDITFGSIMQDAGKKVTELSNSITEGFASIDAERNGYSWNKVKTQMDEYLTDKLKSIGTKNIKDLIKPFTDIVQNFANDSGRFGLENLEYARTAVDSFMSDVGAWEKLGKGSLSKDEQKVGTQIYFFLRNFIDSEAKDAGFDGVGEALTQKSDLYRFGRGIINNAQASGKPSAMIATRPLSLGIKYLFEPFATLLGRVGTSSQAQRIATLKLLQTFGLIPEPNQPATPDLSGVPAGTNLQSGLHGLPVGTGQPTQ